MVARRKQKVVADKQDDSKFDRKELLAGLIRLKSAIRAGASIPELSHMWFHRNYVSAFDGRFGVRVSLDTDLDCGVPGMALLGLLGTSNLKRVSLEGKSRGLAVGLGRSLSKLKVFDADRDIWPFDEVDEPDVDAGISYELSEDFITALRSVLMIKIAKPTRIEHEGVLVYGEKKKFTMYTTDSSTVARAVVSGKTSLLSGLTFFPRLFAEQLVAQCPAGALLTVMDKHFIAVSTDVELYSQMLDTSTVHDMEGLVARNQEGHPPPVLLPIGLKDALDRADILASGELAEVHFSIRDNELHLKGSYVHGDLQERFKLEGLDPDVELPHPDVELLLTVPLLRRALGVTDTFSASDRSITCYSGDDFLYMLSSRR